MGTLLSVLLWAGITFLMLRLGNTLRSPASAGRTDSDGPRLRWVPPAEDVDPVCRKVVKTDKAKPSVHAGSVYYFCSRECREVFEAAPHFYVGNGDSDQRNLEHSHA